MKGRGTLQCPASNKKRRTHPRSSPSTVRPGTLNNAVQHLLGHDVTLGVLPLGTGNDFARSLGIPPTLENACDIIAGGYTARVGVGLANGRPFLNAASLGLASAIARRRTPRFKRRMGRLAYPAWPPSPSSGSTRPSTCG